MRHLSGIAPLADRYDGFILDLWGVIHDGVTAYPGAVDCLQRLAAAGRRVAMLSNAPRRADRAQRMMHRMGIPETLTANLMTSGEAAHLALRDRGLHGAEAWYAGLGAQVYHLGPDRDRHVLDGLDLIRVGTPEDADFVLNTGPDDAHPTTLEPFEAILRACRARGLPMLCANPDLEVIRGGVRVICAGLLAQRYVELGGDVRSLGKPDPAIYGPVMAMLGTAAERTIAVGDALRTDIAGAAAAGIDSCWVLGGLHALAAEDAEDAAAAAGLRPIASVPAFVW